MGLTLAVLAPSIERVIHHHAMSKHFLVIGKGVRQTK